MNALFDLISTGFDNTLSLDGTTPNSMAADIDLNSNDLLNVQRVDAAEFLLGGELLAPGNLVAENASQLTYTPAGTGAVPATVQSKLRESVSVKDFGAVGDGVADDTVAVQAAIDATELITGELDLLGKTYACTGVTIDSTMTMFNGQLNLLDAGTTSVITITSTAPNTVLRDIKTYMNTGTVTATNASGIFVNNVVGVRLYGCEGDGAVEAAGLHGSIYFQDGSDAKLYDCIARNSLGEGIITRSTNNVEFHRCSGFDCGNSGVGTSVGVGLLAVDCYGENSGASGVTFNSQEMMVIRPKSKNNASQNGITIGHVIAGQYAEKVVVVDPIAIGAPSIGLYVAYATDVSIQGGEFYNCGTAAIQVDPNPALTGTLRIGGGTLIDGCVTGIDVTMPSAPADYDIDISDVVIRNFTTYGMNIMVNGEINISGCTLNADPAVFVASKGIQVHGSYTGTVRSGTAKSVSIQDCRIQDTATSAIFAFNCSRLFVHRNSFVNINTSDSVGMPVIETTGVIPGSATKLPTPNPLIVDSNYSWDISAVSPFLDVAVSTFDATQKSLRYKNNAHANITAGSQLTFDPLLYTLYMDIPVHAQMYRGSSNVTLTTATLTTIVYNFASLANGVTTDTGAGSMTTLFEGVYRVSGRMCFAANTVGERSVYVVKNGALYTGVGASSVIGEDVVPFDCVLKLALGDVITIQARQGSGGNLDVVAFGDPSRTVVEMIRIGDG